MNALQYGFYRLYLRKQIAAVERIAKRKVDAVELLQLEVSRREADVHLTEVPRDEVVAPSKSGKIRPGNEAKALSSQRDMVIQRNVAEESSQMTANLMCTRQKNKLEKKTNKSKVAKRKHSQLLMSSDDDENQHSANINEEGNRLNTSLVSSLAAEASSSSSSSFKSSEIMSMFRRTD